MIQVESRIRGLARAVMALLMPWKGNGGGTHASRANSDTHVREGGGSSGTRWTGQTMSFPGTCGRTNGASWAAEEADRMQWIGRFLDKEDMEDADSLESVAAAARVQDEQVEVSPTDLVDRDAGAGLSLSASARHGGSGKVVPAPSCMNLQQRTFVPSDRRTHVQPCSPAVCPCARCSSKAACATGGGEEILCICSGKDDGRELVQCDDCRTWNHLECLGNAVVPASEVVEADAATTAAK
ncbi:hypothetical protein BGW80DRAFT_1253888 [Lactifluus volemus]|nr:hypothetical protein BGW80DRAFT_1253888 [Lactifluus volemus]